MRRNSFFAGRLACFPAFSRGSPCHLRHAAKQNAPPSQDATVLRTRSCQRTSCASTAPRFPSKQSGARLAAHCTSAQPASALTARSLLIIIMSASNPRIIPLEEGWEKEIKAKVSALSWSVGPSQRGAVFALVTHC